MATKNKPGKYDCYTRAEPDEPLFTLLARDPVAPFLVVAWAALRSGKLDEAQQAMTRGAEAMKVSCKKRLRRNSPKIREAYECAKAMYDFWIRKQVERLEKR
jgi:hypothetical protein